MTTLNSRQPYALNRWYGGASLYHDRAFASKLQNEDGWELFSFADWGCFEQRLIRYAVLWAFYENNSYLDVHRWAESRKEHRDLYPFIRSIASLANRAGNFWGTHLLGGQLDPEAGDGKCKPSALPIEIPSEELPSGDEYEGLTPEEQASVDLRREAEEQRHELLRSSLSRLWKDSVWQRSKDTFARKTAVLGDGFLMAVDDPLKERVTIRFIGPETVRDVALDDWGNVRRYEIQEWRRDPEHDDPMSPAPLVRYLEIAEKQGEGVVFTTYRGDDEDPYDWRYYPEGTPESAKVGGQWVEDYPFVPLVKVQFIDVGLPYGWGICYPDLGKLDEIDDLASNIGDYIRICKDSPNFLTGVAPGNENVTNDDGSTSSGLGVDLPNETSTSPSEARVKQVIIKTANPDAKAYSLVATLSIADATNHLQLIIDQFKEDHPELQGDPATASGNGSGRALRVYREKAERLVTDRRGPLDEGQKRVMQMALTMGGMKGYEGYTWIDEGSYDRGELEFSIGERPVFAVDEADKVELEQARASALKTYTDAGMPIPLAMKRVGFSEEEVKEAEERIASDQEANLLRLRATQADRFAGEAQASGGDGSGSSNANAMPMGMDSAPPGSGSNTVAVPAIAVSRYGGQ